MKINPFKKFKLLDLIEYKRRIEKGETVLGSNPIASKKQFLELIEDAIEKKEKNEWIDRELDRTYLV